MISYLKKYYIRGMFIPSFLSLLTNPYYILRKGLYSKIINNKHILTGKLLDFGCGRKPYKELFNVSEYIGLDIEESGHPHDDEQIDIFYDGKNIPFDNDYFDSIFSTEVIEHIFNVEEVLLELNRVLKPGGHILITIPFSWDEHEIPYDFARYTSFGIKHLLTKANFQIISIEKSNNYVESIFQLFCAYTSQNILPKNIKLKILFTPIIITPITIIGIFLGKVLPKSDSLYNNNIVVARKIIDTEKLKA